MSLVRGDPVGTADRTTSACVRILMVAPQPWFTARGTPFSVLHRIRALLAAGHEVDLVTYPFGEDLELPGLKILRSRRPPFVRDVRIGPSIAKLLADVHLYGRTRRALRSGSYEVLHTHEEAAFFGAGLARKHRLVHVYDMHSSLPQQFSNFRAYDFGIVRAVFRRLERHVLRTAGGVITVCDELSRIALRDCGDTPHAMIENTCDNAAVFPDQEHDPRADFGLDGKCIALYMGTFEAYQGLDLLLQSFALVAARRPEAHLLIVGGRTEQVARYREQATEIGIGDAVSFVGHVHPSRITGYVKAADLILSPRTRGMNTPLKIYSYLRSGTPMVATDMPAHTQVLTPQIALLVGSDPDGFARGILELVADGELRRRIGAAAAAFAEEHFSDAGYLARVAAFYEEVLAAARRT